MKKEIVVWNKTKQKAEFSTDYSDDGLREARIWIKRLAKSVVASKISNLETTFTDPRLKESLDVYDELFRLLVPNTFEKRLNDVNKCLHRLNLPLDVCIIDVLTEDDEHYPPDAYGYEF